MKENYRNLKIILTLLFFGIVIILIMNLWFGMNTERSIEHFDSSDSDIQNAVIDAQKYIDLIFEFAPVIDNINNFTQSSQNTLDLQASKNNIQAQKTSRDTQCMYTGIQKYFTDNHLDITQLKSYFSSLISKRDTIFSLIDADVVLATNTNIAASNLLVETKRAMENYKGILEGLPKGNLSELDAIKQKVLADQNYLSTTMQSGKSGSFSNTGLAFKVIDGYFNDNVKYFIENRAKMRPTIQNMTASPPTSTGYTKNISDIKTGTTNGNASIPLDNSWENYAVEWIGYFFTQSPNNNKIETWTFSTNSDDASYVWIGDNAKGDGVSNPTNGAPGYGISNATVKNGNTHAMNLSTGTANLLSNTYYPFRIQFGEQGGGDNIVVSFSSPSVTSRTNGDGFYFSNADNPKSNMPSNPRINSSGLFFHVKNGYFGTGGDNIDYFLNNENEGFTGMGINIWNSLTNIFYTKEKTVEGFWSGDKVTVYDDCKQGAPWSKTYPVGKYNLSNMNGGGASQFGIPDGLQVQIFSSTDWTGLSTVINSKNSPDCLTKLNYPSGGNWNDRVKSFIVSSTDPPPPQIQTATIPVQTQVNGFGNTRGTPRPLQSSTPVRSKTGPSTGYTQKISDICTSTGGNKNCMPNDNTEHTFSVEWVGYFYTKSASTSNTPQTWTFKLDSDDASYLWIGETAQGNGINAEKYTTSNALINNGGLHGMNAVTRSIGLLPNEYYPIRIQFGENGGNYNVIMSFIPPGGAPTTNGTGYFFSNTSNPNSNTGGFNQSEFATEYAMLLSDQQHLGTLQAQYNSVSSAYNAGLLNYNNALSVYNTSVGASSQASINLTNAQMYQMQIKNVINQDVAAAQSIIDNISIFFEKTYVDRFGISNSGLEAYLTQAVDAPYSVISLNPPPDNNGECSKTNYDNDNQLMSSYFMNGSCYYTRYDTLVL